MSCSPPGSRFSSRVTGLLALLAGLCSWGCSPAIRVLGGMVDRDPLAVSARLTVKPESTRVALRIDNRGAEPVAVELDRVVVRTGAGESLSPLGRPQRFREHGSGRGGGTVRRVALDTVTIEPRGRAEVDLELPELPARGPFSLLVPSLHRLGIEGQRPLPSLQIPLRLDAAASAEASRSWDPFEE